MCGILGAVTEKFLSVFEKTVDQLRHRGPDERNIIQKTHAGNYFSAASTRLSIVNQTQKLTIDYGCHIVLYNGEIWNYNVLKQKYDLNQEANEVDLILALYKKNGIEFASELDGMFAIAIIDLEKEVVMLVSDPVGIKPLFYTQNRNAFAFASDIKSIAQMDVIKDAKLNNSYFQNVFTFGLPEEEETILDEVFMMPPSSTLAYDVNQGSIELSTYKSKVAEGSPIIQDIEGLEEALSNSLLKRYKHTESYPIALLLSGGIDSSLLAALSKKLGLEKIQCFFLGSEQSTDYKWAKLVADNLELSLEIIELNAKEMAQDLLNLQYYSPGMGGMHIYTIFKKIKERYPEIKVAWCGEGADEVFAGYSRYRDPVGFFEGMLKNARFYETRTGLSQQLEELSTNSKEPLENVYSFLKRGPLVKNHLLPFDHSSMAHSIELRVPYLDLAIFNRVSTEHVFRDIENGNQKSWLKELLKRLTGIEEEEFYNRKKVGFPHLAPDYKPELETRASSTYATLVKSKFPAFVKNTLDRVALGLLHHIYIENKGKKVDVPSDFSADFNSLNQAQLAEAVK